MCDQNRSQTILAENYITPKHTQTSFNYRSTYPRNIYKNEQVTNNIIKHKTTDVKWSLAGLGFT